MVNLDFLQVCIHQDGHVVVVVRPQVVIQTTISNREQALRLKGHITSSYQLRLEIQLAQIEGTI